MSTNKGQVIVSGYHVEGDNRRLYKVSEERNSHDSHNSGITLYANTYTHFTFTQEYKTSKFLFCDVVITNRFTMDRTRFTIDFSNTALYNDDNVVNVDEIKNEESAHYESDTDVKFLQIYAYDDNDQQHRNWVNLKLSMADFMYGDICVQFYDDPNNKDQYCAPVIVQFTNAPTVNAVGLYKWRPNFTTRDVEDYDNIFTSSFGSRLTDIADEGRTDVLTGNALNAEYYNDFMKSDRLITNGYADPEKHDGNEVSLSGHPVYMVEYRTFVPSAFSEMFGINHSPTAVSFSAINEEKGYLTSAVDDWQIMHDDKLNLRMYTQNDADGRRSFLNPEFQLSAAKSGTNPVTTIGGIRRVYVAHLTAASANRPDDEWFRDHTRVCADFVLTGLDPYWTGESDELPVLDTDRLYYVFKNVSYTPNVFELSWFAAGRGTSYYLVKKRPANTDRTEWINDTNNWIQVFTKENNSNYLLSDKTICADNKTVMCKENDPVSVQAYDGVKYITDPSQCIYDNIEDIELDNNGRPLVVYENYQTVGVLHGRRSFSDNSILSNDAYPAFADFRVMNETVENGLHAVVYRVSDNGSSDSNFELDDADAEFAIIYRA